MLDYLKNKYFDYLKSRKVDTSQREYDAYTRNLLKTLVDEKVVPVLNKLAIEKESLTKLDVTGKVVLHEDTSILCPNHKLIGNSETKYCSFYEWNSRRDYLEKLVREACIKTGVGKINGVSVIDKKITDFRGIGDDHRRELDTYEVVRVEINW